jgi:nitroreductase
MAKSQGYRRLSRRDFLKDAGLVAGGAAISSMTALSACGAPAQTIITQTTPTTVTLPGATVTVTASPPSLSATTPPPPIGATVATTTLAAALASRKSATAFQTQPVPKDKLLALLWAAWGINRPESGKRTAPSAVNAQEIDIYVAQSDGVYLYDARANQLTLVSAQDARARAATMSSLQSAPVHLLFVADYTKLGGIAQPQKELWSASHTGFIGQNVYLFCAAEGLGARFHTSVDRAALKDILKLRTDQAVVFAQVVGYPR